MGLERAGSSRCRWRCHELEAPYTKYEIHQRWQLDWTAPVHRGWGTFLQRHLRAFVNVRPVALVTLLGLFGVLGTCTTQSATAAPAPNRIVPTNGPARR